MIASLPLSCSDPQNNVTQSESTGFETPDMNLKECNVRCLLDVATLEKLCIEQSVRMGTYQYAGSVGESENKGYKHLCQVPASHYERIRGSKILSGSVILKGYTSGNFAEKETETERNPMLKKIDIRCLQDIASLEKICIEQNLRMSVYHEINGSSDAESCDSDGSIRSE